MGEAADRLRHYCARALHSRSDFHAESRCLAPALRRIVWNDAEVRDVLLKAGESRVVWDALVAEVGHERGLPLLDLMSAMSLEARTG